MFDLSRARPDWQQRAACRDPDVPTAAFFPDPTDHEGQEWAKGFCATCPVRGECADDGLREAYGVWGGTSQRQRARLRRQLKITAITSYLYDDTSDPAPESEAS